LHRYILHDGKEAEANGGKGLKALRLLKLPKMLRIARVKNSLSQGMGTDINFQQYFSFIFTVGIVLFLAHMLAW
jgi:hypothetical protein